MFLRAARHAELDTMRGVSANVMCGQEGYFGTSSFQIVLDMDEMINQEEETWTDNNYNKTINDSFGLLDNPDDPCSTNNIAIINNYDDGGCNEDGDCIYHKNKIACSGCYEI